MDKVKEVYEIFKQNISFYSVIVLTFLLVLFAILYYIYFSLLEERECSLMDNVYGSINGKLKSLPANSEYKLVDYYIKSAYNCCSGGAYKNDYVNLCVLKDLIKQGVRGLDFELFALPINGKPSPVVATSTSDSNYVKETFNSIPFTDVMNVLSTYAFSSGNCPNPLDPLILHLRIKSTNKEMYQQLADIFKQYENLLLSSTYSYNSNSTNTNGTSNANNALLNAPISSLLGKIIIIIDKSYGGNTFMDVSDFYELVNLTSNSLYMRALHYYDIKYSPDLHELIEFNRQGMTIGMPDKGSNPENPSATLMREAGFQMLAMRYQQVDANSEECEVFFNTAGYAFVLKPEELRYIPIVVEEPEEQKPELSYATRTIESDYYHFNI